MKRFIFFICSFLFVFVLVANAQIDLGIDEAEDNIAPQKQQAINKTKNKKDESFFSLDKAFNLFSMPDTVVPQKEVVVNIDELKKKAGNGDVQAQLDLGYMFLYGKDGANIDYKQAIHYYELAAQNKNPVALNNMGSLYFNGIGVDVNYTKAIKYFEDAAKYGSNDAAINLAIIYLGTDKNNKNSEIWQRIFSLLKQAQTSNSNAKFLLGYSYYKGFLVQENHKKAFQLIKQASEEGYDEAQYILSRLYLLGHGTTKNYNNAIKYLELASEQGNMDAMILLADILVEGKLYKQDIEKAYILYNVASVKGSEKAAQKRDQIENMLKIDELLTVQATAENYEEKPTNQTIFVRKTFGSSLKAYIDTNIEKASGIIVE